eukprot:2790829-Alexandrium_andersonii.AAC.1
MEGADGADMAEDALRGAQRAWRLALPASLRPSLTPHPDEGRLPDWARYGPRPARTGPGEAS